MLQLMQSQPGWEMNPAITFLVITSCQSNQSGEKLFEGKNKSKKVRTGTKIPKNFSNNS